MYGCYALKLNYEEYLKKEKETDAILKTFSEEEWDWDEEEFEPLEEAYIVKLDMEVYDVEYNGYYVILIGDSNFDIDKMCDVVFDFDESYKEYSELKKKDIKTMTEQEKMNLIWYGEQFALIEGEELGEEFEELMGGEEVPFGEIVKKIF